MPCLLTCSFSGRIHLRWLFNGQKRQLQNPRNPQIKEKIFTISFWSATVCNYEMNSDTALGLNTSLSLLVSRHFVCILGLYHSTLLQREAGCKMAHPCEKVVP